MPADQKRDTLLAPAEKAEAWRDALEKAREFIECSAFNVPTKDYFDAVMADIDACLNTALPEDQREDERGWRPIETAPKTGTEVDLWCVSIERPDGERVCNCRWTTMTSWYGSEIIGWSGVSHMYRTDRRPTHWRPIPAPPLNSETKS